MAESENNYLLLDQSIQHSHQDWMASFEMLKDPIFIHDENLHIIRCNHAYQQQAGIPYNQIIGRPYYDIFPKTHAPLHNCLPAMEKGAAKGSKKTVQIGDLHYLSHAYVVRDENQNYLYSVHMLEDVTERIKTQKALQASEAQYRRLFEAAKDGILILDGETGIIVDANPFILDLTAYTFNEITGKSLWEIGLIADIAANKISFEELQKNYYVRYEHLPIQTKDGRRINVEFVSNIYLVGSRRVIQCNIRDITEQIRSKQLLQESEEKFRSITTTAQDAILIMSSEGNITYWNEAAENMFGYTKEEAIGKALHPLLAPERFKEAHRRGFSHFIKTGEGPAIGKTLELTALKKDGTEFPIELSLSANRKEGKWEAIG
ncbi:MAG: PAS domain S-box protein, partial [Thiovulaceae bacterium]|nr:PAS domain S-box protein [Sulfurimonadaceae bacterium]